MLPTEEVGFAAKGAVIGLAGLPLDCGVERRQSSHANASRKHRLPNIS
jgi:hypothetical protein